MECPGGTFCSSGRYLDHILPSLNSFFFMYTVRRVEARDHQMKAMTLTMYVNALNFYLYMSLGNVIFVLPLLCLEHLKICN